MATVANPHETLDAIEAHNFNFLRFHDETDPVSPEDLRERHRVLLTVKKEYMQTMSKLHILEALATDDAFASTATYESVSELKEAVMNAKVEATELRQAVTAGEKALHAQIAKLMRSVDAFQSVRGEYEDAAADPAAEEGQLDILAMLARDAELGCFGGAATQESLAMESVSACAAVEEDQDAVLASLIAAAEEDEAAAAAADAETAALTAAVAATTARAAAAAAEAAECPEQAELAAAAAAAAATAGVFAGVAGADVDTSSLASKGTVQVNFRRLPIATAGGAAGARMPAAALTVFFQPASAGASAAGADCESGAEGWRLWGAQLLGSPAVCATDISVIVTRAVETQDFAFLVREVHDALRPLAQ